MAGFMKRAQVYLGLGPDDEYEDYDGVDERPPVPLAREVGAARPAPPRTRPSSVSAPPRQRPAPGPAPSRPPPPSPPEAEHSAVRPMAPPRGEFSTVPKPKPVVRQVAANAKPYVVTPRTFNHAQDVADKFKGSQPVILNLQGVDRELARRLIDFSSGLCYGLSGNMEKVANSVYLLTPSNVEVSAEERRRLQERGLHE